jgi:hypothetical protein
LEVPGPWTVRVRLIVCPTLADPGVALTVYGPAVWSQSGARLEVGRVIRRPVVTAAVRMTAAATTR